MDKYKPMSRGGNVIVKINPSEFNNELAKCKKNGRISERMGLFILNISKNIVLKMLGGNRFEIREEAQQRLIMTALNKLLKLKDDVSGYNYLLSVLINDCKNYITRNKFDFAGNVTDIEEVELKINNL